MIRRIVIIFVIEAGGSDTSALFSNSTFPVSPSSKINDFEELEPYELLELIGAKRGMLIKGGETDTERAAVMLLDEYRSGKLGRFTLEMPEAEV